MKIDATVRIFELALEQFLDGDDFQSRLLVALADGTGGGRLVGVALPSREFSQTGKDRVRSSCPDQIAAVMLDHGDSDSDRR